MDWLHMSYLIKHLQEQWLGRILPDQMKEVCPDSELWVGKILRPWLKSRCLSEHLEWYPIINIDCQKMIYNPGMWPTLKWTLFWAAIMAAGAEEGATSIFAMTSFVCLVDLVWGRPPRYKTWASRVPVAAIVFLKYSIPLILTWTNSTLRITWGENNA